MSWSIVNNGFGSNWNIFADKVAAKRGRGINNLFLLISLSNLFNIFFNEIFSGPTHSIILECIFLEMTWYIISVKSEQCIGANFVLPL